MQNTEITAASPNLAELAAREQLTPPEHHSVADDATRKEAPPTPEAGHPHVAQDNININVFNPEEPHAPQQPVVAPAPHPVADSALAVPVAAPTMQAASPAVVPTAEAGLIVEPSEFKQAEKNLADYIGQTINSQLLKGDEAHPEGLILSLSNMIGDNTPNAPVTKFQLSFRGPMIESNFAEASREILEALRSHHVISALMSNHSVTIDQIRGDADEQTLNLHLPNLTPGQYASLIKDLSASAIAHVVHHHTDEAIKDAEITAIQDKALEHSDMHVAEGGSLVDAAGHAINAEASPGINNADTRIEVPAKKEIKLLREAPAEAQVMGV